MNNTRRVPLLLFTTGLAFGALALHGRAARAQIDTIRYASSVYESGPGGAPVLVGEILREDVSPSRYVEHWVLSPDYVNPGPTNGVVLQLRPSLHSYRDLGDFLSRAPFPRGSRYVHVDCADSTERPTVTR